MTTKSEITGTLSRVIFSNQETHFIIGAFQGDNGQFSALGTLPNAQPGMNYILTGAWQQSPKYGHQFKFDLYHIVEPTDTRGIFNFIVRVCNFVGPTTGSRIVDKYQENTLQVLKEDPGRLAKDIKGITTERALEIQEELLKHAEYEQVIIRLETLLDVPGMRKSLMTDLLKTYKHEAADRVMENPYFLVQFHGIGFALADKVAVLNVGFPRDSIERRKAAAIHAMKQVNQEGHVWVSRADLVEKVRELIQVKGLDEGIRALIVDESLIERDGDVAFMGMAREEHSTARMLIRLERMAA